MRNRIAIFDDNKNIRNSIILLLTTDPSFEIVGSYSSVRNCVEKVLLSQPDIILMDIEMAADHETDTIPELKKAMPQMHILIQTVFEDEEKIHQLIQAGAAGYILKSSLNQSLRTTILALTKTGHQ